MKKKALLIGIDEYDFLGQLSFARKDAEGFAGALREQCGFHDNELTVMTCGSKGGLRGVRRYIERQLSDLSETGDLDLLIFGFWGHGFTPEGGRRYLCGQNAEDDNLERTAVSFDVVKAKLAQVGALNTLLVIDCCQNKPLGRGVASDLEEGTEEQFASMARDIQTSRKQVSGKGVPTTAIMNSCREGQRAFEWEEKGHGIFTAHLLDGLAEGKTSIAQLASHVCDRTPKTARTLYLKEQVPWFFIEGRGDITLPNINMPPPKTKAMAPWWVEVNGENKGPLSQEEVRALITSGDATAVTPCWRKGMADWQELGQTPEWVELLAIQPIKLPILPPIRKPFIPNKQINLKENAQDNNENHTVSENLQKPHSKVRSFAAKPKTLHSLLSKVELPAGLEAVDEATFVSVEGLYDGSTNAQSNQREWQEKGWPLEIILTELDMPLRLVPPGSFAMGSLENPEQLYQIESPQHKVTIEKPFYVGKFPVTQFQWKQIMGGQSYYKTPNPKAPAETMSWEECNGFIQQLEDQGIRLLSESEWEYACRAGTVGDRYGDLNKITWCRENGANSTYPIGQLQPNAWGLHDIVGNLWEWVEDNWHDSYKRNPSVDGSVWKGGDIDHHILRGGAWYSIPWHIRSAFRLNNNSRCGVVLAGFRVALTLEE